MAIQFRCAGCSQPIEVDDEYAGQNATCPYCRHIIRVPAESSLNVGDIAPAQPPDGPLPPSLTEPSATEQWQAPSEELHIGPRPLTHREHTARSWGNYALIFAALAIGMFGSAAIYSAALYLEMVQGTPESQPSSQQIEELQRTVSEIPWLIPVELGGMFFAVLGVCLGLASLSQSARGNWRGWISVIGCGGLLLCICSMTAIAASTGLGA